MESFIINVFFPCFVSRLPQLLRAADVTVLTIFSSLSEQSNNPNAVLSALKTYEHSFKRTDHNKYLGADSMEDITEDETEDSRSSTASSSNETSDTTSPSAEDTKLEIPEEVRQSKIVRN